MRRNLSSRWRSLSTVDQCKQVQTYGSSFVCLMIGRPPMGVILVFFFFSLGREIVWHICLWHLHCLSFLPTTEPSSSVTSSQWLMFSPFCLTVFAVFSYCFPYFQQMIFFRRFLFIQNVFVCYFLLPSNKQKKKLLLEIYFFLQSQNGPLFSQVFVAALLAFLLDSVGSVSE